MSNEKKTGGCLCRKITYSFNESAVISASHCHCTDCQKSTGSGKATILMVTNEALEVQGDLKFYTVTGTDGSHISRGFCEDCGSPLLSLIEEVENLRLIKAGSLDDSSWIRIDSSFWSSSARHWSPVDETLPSFTQNPQT
tara:strand:+ start:2435 stop:2854 length:420 start_codon:yes stop_codon:yes gene_type:complete